MSDNFRYVLTSRIYGTNVLRREVTAAWEVQGLVFSQKIIKLIKHHDDKGRTYDVIPLNLSINNHDVYNTNELIKMLLF
jgi:hypothetical protein